MNKRPSHAGGSAWGRGKSFALALMSALALVLSAGRGAALDLYWASNAPWNLTGGTTTFLVNVDVGWIPTRWVQGSSAVFQASPDELSTVSMPDAGEYDVNVFSGANYTFNAGGNTSLSVSQLAGLATLNNFQNVTFTNSFINAAAVSFGGSASQIAFTGAGGIGIGAVAVTNASQMSIGDNGIILAAVNFTGSGGSLLVNTATAAGIQGGTVTMSGDATTLKVTQGTGITGGTETFSGSGSQLVAGSAGAVAGGDQIFSGSDSAFRVTTAGGVTGGVVRLQRNAILSIEADHATSTGAVIFDNSLGGLGGIVGLNGHDTTLAYLGSAQAGAGLIRNGAATDATLTLAMTGTSGFTGVLADGAGGGKLNLNIAGSGTLYLGESGPRPGPSRSPAGRC